MIQWQNQDTTIIHWEQQLSAQVEFWFPPTPTDADVTLEGDEVYTRVDEPPSESPRWPIHFIKSSLNRPVPGIAQVRHRCPRALIKLFAADCTHIFLQAAVILQLRLGASHLCNEQLYLGV